MSAESIGINRGAGVDVGASIDQQRSYLRRPSGDGPVQRRASGAVAAMYEARIGIEQRADFSQIAGFRRHVDWMVQVGFGGCNPPPSSACLLQEVRDGVEACPECALILEDG